MASYNFFLNLFQKFLHNLGLFMTDWISRLPRLIFQCKHINEFVFFFLRNSVAIWLFLPISYYFKSRRCRDRNKCVRNLRLIRITSSVKWNPKLLKFTVTSMRFLGRLPEMMVQYRKVSNHYQHLKYRGCFFNNPGGYSISMIQI